MSGTPDKFGELYEWLDTSFYALFHSSEEYRTACLDECGCRKFVHYTSIDSFFIMLGGFIKSKEDKRVKIFPSHLRYLNDSREYMEGYDALREIKINDRKPFGMVDPLDNQYIVSFCGQADLLSQWKYYGKDSGVAIEFDFLDDQGDAQCDFEWGHEKISTFPHCVFYNSHSGMLGNIYEYIRDYSGDNDKEKIFGLLIPYCKNEAFAEERESRLVFLPGDAAISYRVNDKKAVPQFECYVSYIDEKHKKPPIKNIVVGPGQNQIVVFNAIVHALQNNKESIKFFNEKQIQQVLKQSKIDESTQLYIEEKYGKKYVTYKTDTDITVQLSPTPFRP